MARPTCTANADGTTIPDDVPLHCALATPQLQKRLFDLLIDAGATRVWAEMLMWYATSPTPLATSSD
jgi:hypothetical protein